MSSTHIIQDQVLKNFDTVMTTEGGLEQYERVMFSDNIKLKQFARWQEKRNAMMKTHKKQSNNGESSSKDRVTWQANVELPSGTALDRVIDFLMKLQSDLCVYTISFSGTESLNGCWFSSIPFELCKLIDGDTHQSLKHSIVVSVTCGWGEQDQDSWLEILDDCVLRLSEKTRATSRHSMVGRKLDGTDRRSVKYLTMFTFDDDRDEEVNTLNKLKSSTNTAATNIDASWCFDSDAFTAATSSAAFSDLSDEPDETRPI